MISLLSREIGKLLRSVSLLRFLFLVLILPLISCNKSSSPVAKPVFAPFETPATERIVMYEINPGAFSASKDFNGIILRLDSIKSLGVNTIWLMPIYPVGNLKSFGSPYCVKDYTTVNSGLGTLADLQHLVSKAHEKKIAVILDWVGNHTSWDNGWMIHPDWYTRDGNGNIISPEGTNWTDVADLNFGNREMRIAMIKAMKYWIENADVDGFRCDAADFIPFDFWKQAIDELTLSTTKKLILLAEGSRLDHFDSGFGMNFSWNYLAAIKKVFAGNQEAGLIFSANTEEYGAVPSGKRKLRFTTNHDESNSATPITVFKGKKGALAASVITIFLEGVPLIYCGQEVGADSPSSYNGNSLINWNNNRDLLLDYTRLLNFYAGSNLARNGTLETFPDANVVAFHKTGGAEQLLIIVNSRSAAQIFSVPVQIRGSWTDALSGNPVDLSDAIPLNGYDYFILKK